jgi:hypothetical protein
MYAYEIIKNDLIYLTHQELSTDLSYRIPYQDEKCRYYIKYITDCGIILGDNKKDFGLFDKDCIKKKIVSSGNSRNPLYFYVNREFSFANIVAKYIIPKITSSSIVKGDYDCFYLQRYLDEISNMIDSIDILFISKMRMYYCFYYISNGNIINYFAVSLEEKRFLYFFNKVKEQNPDVSKIVYYFDKDIIKDAFNSLKIENVKDSAAFKNYYFKEYAYGSAKK